MTRGIAVAIGQVDQEELVLGVGAARCFDDHVERLPVGHTFAVDSAGVLARVAEIGEVLFDGRLVGFLGGDFGRLIIVPIVGNGSREAGGESIHLHLDSPVSFPIKRT